MLCSKQQNALLLTVLLPAHTLQQASTTCCCFAFAAHALQQAAKRAATYCAVASPCFAASKHNTLRKLSVKASGITIILPPYRCWRLSLHQFSMD
jgi:hypothetical protein